MTDFRYRHSRTARHPVFAHLRSRQRNLTRQANDWLRRYPRVKRALDATGCLKGGAEGMARGVAVGLFFGLTPTVGFQTLLMIIGCMVVRGNFLAAFVLSWVSNPVTMGPMYWALNVIGEVVLTTLPLRTEASGFWFMQEPVNEATYAVVGSLLVAPLAAGAGYLVSRRISAAIAARRRRGPRRYVAS